MTKSSKAEAEKINNSRK